MHHNLESLIANIPFYYRTILRNYGLKPGKRLQILHPYGERKVSRSATLVDVDAYLRLLVKYDNPIGGRVYEADVPISRIDVFGFTPRAPADRVDRGYNYELRMGSFNFEHESFVLLLTGLFKTRVFMPRDVLVHANLSNNTEMYTIERGVVLDGVERWRIQVRHRRLLISRVEQVYILREVPLRSIEWDTAIISRRGLQKEGAPFFLCQR